MEKQFVIHSQKMAGWLMYKGNKMIKTAQNKRQLGYHIFIFADTDKLHIDMTEYTKCTT
ncbi:DUF5659 domain-containing protein [Paenibacillus sp. J22TS3]|uniref:DUF5659 domain-containing protein n=1 Tax=Paenibacillus sp. J22TS3 TaxID=2807192 RepID=UPI001B282612|nr:DUF5659 domain-containing protein [Paenibacillus sp. J22TS3]GIP21052.1 hypothetical protein J22TS3_13270 [Paenibacillus sp. J22TS3]